MALPRVNSKEQVKQNKKIQNEAESFTDLLSTLINMFQEIPQPSEILSWIGCMNIIMITKWYFIQIVVNMFLVAFLS